jgi:hypothetical protein
VANQGRSLACKVLINNGLRACKQAAWMLAQPLQLQTEDSADRCRELTLELKNNRSQSSEYPIIGELT